MNFKNYFLFFLMVFLISSCAIKKNDDKITDLKNVSIEQVFNNTVKIAPGCIKGEKLESLKNYLRDNCKIDLDKEKIINISYKMPINLCGKDYTSYTLKDKGDSKNPHFQDLNSLNHKIIYIQNDGKKVDNNWFFDKNNLILNLLLNEKNNNKCDALITISDDGIYFTSWSFSVAICNAFGNAIPTYKCE
jgi:hypothetical protein